MKQTVLIIVALLSCVQVGYAQTPCEKSFNEAKTLYNNKQYANAKAQFQKVVKNCNSNKELAQAYIDLCDGWIGLNEEKRVVKEQNKSASISDANKIKELQEQIRSLQVKNDEYSGTIENSAQRLAEQNTNLAAKSDTIRMEREKNAALYQSLREKGNELNGYLNAKLSKTNKKKIQSYDKVSDSTLMDVFGENLKLVKELKK